MTEDQFNNLYISKFKPDPVLRECVEYLQDASEDEIKEAKKEGYFTAKNIRDAKHLIKLQNKKNNT